jgi:cobalt-zinc-cadmium efflux system outer membrane protein
MQGHLLERAARARDLVRLQYEKGAASLFELLDAQRTFLGTQNEYLQTLNDYWIAVFQLEQATGLELYP